MRTCGLINDFKEQQISPLLEWSCSSSSYCLLTTKATQLKQINADIRISLKKETKKYHDFCCCLQFFIFFYFLLSTLRFKSERKIIIKKKSKKEKIDQKHEHETRKIKMETNEQQKQPAAFIRERKKESLWVNSKRFGILYSNYG